MIAKTERTIFSLKTEWLACLFLAICAFSTPISVTATTISFLLAWALILLSGNWTERWRTLKANPAALAFWVLFCLFVIGLTYTISPSHLAFKDLQKRHWLLIAPFFMMILSNDLWRRRIINAFLAAMVITLFLSFSRHLGLKPPLLLAKHLRHGANVFFEHIVQSFFMGIAAFIFAYRALYEQKRRALYLTLFLLCAINILFLSKGRTGYFQLGLLILFLSFISYRTKGMLLAISIGLLTLFTAYHFSPTFHSRLNDVAQDTKQHEQGFTTTPTGIRIAMWHSATALIKERPWFGYGTGGIKAAMQDYLPPHLINKTGLIDYVENSFLNFTLEFGVIGLLVFLSFIITLFLASTRLNNEYRHLIQAFLISYLAGSLVNSFFVSFCEAHLLALFAAICFSAYQPSYVVKTQKETLPYEAA